MINMELRDQTARDYLATTDMVLLDHAWSSAEGTLDVVLAEDNTLVVVAITNCIYRLSHPRCQRMRRLAVAWMTDHGKVYDRVRVDIVGVSLLPMGQSNLEHVRSVDA